MLVVVCTGAGRVLLLRRVHPRGYWQSVTGALHARETAFEAAAREVREETGLAGAERLRRWGRTFRYRIHPAWRPRYSAGAEFNTEHVFVLELPGTWPIRLRSQEHCDYGWFEFSAAAMLASSWTNREVIREFGCRARTRRRPHDVPGAHGR